MDASPWPQGIGLIKVPMEGTRPIIEKARPLKDQALNCPRCNSTNTKFCYYNNYSLYQPRYFCKTCRRYWTEGGTLRNVPVGGGSRKNKRSSSTTPPTFVAPSSSNKKLPDISSATSTGFPLSLTSQNPKIHQGQDLNLAYPTCTATDQDYTALSKLTEVTYTNESNHQNPISKSSTSSPMELIKGGITSREFGSFMSIPVPNLSALYATGLPSLPEFKASSSFSVEGFGSGYGSGPIDQGVQETGARLLFPLEELKSLQGPGQSNAGFDQNRSGQGFWSGLLGEGTW